MELLNIELIQNYSPWHEKIHFFESIDSTNTHALQLGETGAPEGTVVIAEEQLRGRGQFERSWFSPARTGLWMSLLLRPTIKPETIPALSHFAVVALYDAILKMKIPINDLERFKKSYGRCSARNEEHSPAVYSDTRGHEHRSDAAMRGYNSFENALLNLAQPPPQQSIFPTAPQRLSKIVKLIFSIL